jgi:hypothetical protein
MSSTAPQVITPKLKALVLKADHKLVDLQRTLETHHAADEVSPKLQLASLVALVEARMFFEAAHKEVLSVVIDMVNFDDQRWSEVKWGDITEMEKDGSKAAALGKLFRLFPEFASGYERLKASLDPVVKRRRIQQAQQVHQENVRVTRENEELRAALARYEGKRVNKRLRLVGDRREGAKKEEEETDTECLLD